MNKYLKAFLHRGLIFGGFGPIVLGIVYWALDTSLADFSLTGSQLLLGILSVYILAFVQAGVSVFNQIDHWSVPKSLLWHFGVLFVTYLGCYLLNDWIPFHRNVVLIFSGIFVAGYLVIWLTVYISTKLVSKKLNAKLQ